jgi:hypothetical protein
VLASQAGLAIHNARLYEETRRRERWLDAVRDITNAVLSGTGSDQELVLIASRARDLVAADLTTVVILDPDGNEPNGSFLHRVTPGAGTTRRAAAGGTRH